MMSSIYCVYDSKVGAFERPFFCRSRGEAIRTWESISNNPETMMCKYSGDYTLFELGSFDILTGNFNLHEARINLGTALEFKSKATQVPMFSDSAATVLKGVS